MQECNNLVFRVHFCAVFNILDHFPRFCNIYKTSEYLRHRKSNVSCWVKIKVLKIQQLNIQECR